jgi:hypothetical protein
MQVQVQETPLAAVGSRCVSKARRTGGCCQSIVQLAAGSAGGCSTARVRQGQLAGWSSWNALEEDGTDAVELEAVEDTGHREVAGRSRDGQHLVGDPLAETQHDIPVAPGRAGASA